MLALSSARCDLLMAYYSPLAPMTLEEKFYPSVYLGTDRLIPVCVADESGEPRFTLNDTRTRNIPMLAYPPETFFGRLCNGLIRFSVHHHHFNIVAQSPSPEVLQALVQKGAGIAWLPERCIKSALQEGRLIQAGGDAWCCNLEIRLYVSHERTKVLQSNLWENIKELQEASFAAG